MFLCVYVFVSVCVRMCAWMCVFMCCLRVTVCKCVFWRTCFKVSADFSAILRKAFVLILQPISFTLIYEILARRALKSAENFEKLEVQNELRQNFSAALHFSAHFLQKGLMMLIKFLHLKDGK